MSTTFFTLKLLSLKCMQPQELDGDELYLKLNGEPIWYAGELRMHAHPANDHTFSELDFVGGRKHGKEGWLPLEGFTPETFAFPGQTGMTHLQLWERDILCGDDRLGSAPISAHDAEGGHISIVFQGDGASYMLTYQVTI